MELSIKYLSAYILQKRRDEGHYNYKSRRTQQPVEEPDKFKIYLDSLNKWLKLRWKAKLPRFLQYFS